MRGFSLCTLNPVFSDRAPQSPYLSFHLQLSYNLDLLPYFAQMLALSLDDTTFKAEPTPYTVFEFEMEAHVEVNFLRQIPTS